MLRRAGLWLQFPYRYHHNTLKNKYAANIAAVHHQVAPIPLAVTFFAALLSPLLDLISYIYRDFERRIPIIKIHNLLIDNSLFLQYTD